MFLKYLFKSSITDRRIGNILRNLSKERAGKAVKPGVAIVVDGNYRFILSKWCVDPS